MAPSGDDLTDVTGGDRTDPTKIEGQRFVRPQKHLERGTLVGRYVVIGVVGEGGMGIVYNAIDPELDRKVAIKLMQAKSGDGSSPGGTQARLVREAQALARLSHPNVIAVHDVGTLPGDRVFVAMELVEGVTLRAWMKERTRSWRDVVPVMLAAGAGLGAAHAAGLVHRDFKPENVLVGNDRRVRVMDFGLARLQSEDDTPPSRISDLSIEARSPLSDSLTIAGNVLGTPAYMAPEIYDDVPAGPRSDQFAFGVALYEALYGHRPFEKKALVPPRASTPVPKPPPKIGVPPAIERVVMRALSIDPDARYPSMEALLADLGRDPTKSRRQRVAFAAALGVLAAALGGGLVLTGRDSLALGITRAGKDVRDEMCTGFDHRLAGAWDDTKRQAVKIAFDKSTRPFAAESYAKVRTALDRYATDWTTATTESCRATRIRGTQPEDALALRQDCFDQRLRELGAFAELLTEADDATIEKAPDGALKLDPLARCDNVAALRAPPQPPAAALDKVRAVYSKLAAAKASVLAGKLGLAVMDAKEGLELAKPIKFDPLEAEVGLVLGMAAINVGGVAEAAEALEQATWAALRGKRDDIAALAALYAALATSEGLHDNTAARLWLGIGTSAAIRFGAADRQLEHKSLEIEGVVAGGRGDLIAAATAHEKALALAIQIYGREHALVARSEQLLAATYARASNYTKSLVHYEHALAIITAYLGPDHPDVALLLSGLGSCYHYTGDDAKSRAAFTRALELREKIFGPNSPVLITTLNNYTELLRDTGDLTTGIATIERAKAITEKTVGKLHPYSHAVLTTYAELLMLANRTDEAQKILDEVLPLEDKTSSTVLPDTLVVRARLALGAKKWADAVPFAERSIAGFEKSAGKDAPDLWKPLTALARAKIGLGKPAEAQPLLERALAIGAKAKVRDKDLAPARELLASLAKTP
jgi:eukaryotic-like serine/threonine-protein kinase